ncbi:MAG: ATPase [Glaciihabitans sp.]|nr:ATPase [Glaciihabitans sp.]
MRIKRLTIAGFGPYKNEQHVDFEQFEDDGIFLITGKTGAGKSSILDAICYALYNSVPRYEGTQQQLRSDHCDVADPTFVELEFSVNGIDYRVHRTPEYERPKQRGAGVTKQAATAELFQWVNDTWQGRSARAVDVGRDLDTILGLTKDQFLQVVLLAQNRFQRFLKANNDERQAVLRTLFGTRRFDQIETLLVDRRKVLEGQLSHQLEELSRQARQVSDLLQDDSPIPEEPSPEWFESAVQTLSDQLESATTASAATDTAVSEADTEHQQQLARRRGQERRTAAAAALLTLRGAAGTIAVDTGTLDLARRANTVWSHIEARRAADKELDAALSDESVARQAYAAVASGPVSADELAQRLDELTRQLGALTDVLADEQRLPDLAQFVAAAGAEASRCAEAVTEGGAQVESIPRQLAEVAEEISALQVHAARTPDLKESADRLAAAVSAARLAVSLGEQKVVADAAERAASAVHTRAAIALDDLLEERLSGHAAELALSLVDGEPCAVCGSPEHPAPAKATGSIVTEADIKSARAALATTRVGLDSAAATSQQITDRHVDAIARSDGKSVEVLVEAHTAATNELARARAAGDRAEALGSSIAALQVKLDGARRNLAARAVERDNALRRLAETESEQRTIAGRVEGQRAGFPSVSDRVSSLTSHREITQRLANTITSTENQRITQERAISALKLQLLDHGFANDAAADAARRTAADVAALEKGIRDHDQAIATAQATLAEAELAALPVDVIDPGPAAERLSELRRIRDVALTRRSSLAERLASVKRICGVAQRDYAGSSLLRQEHNNLRQLASAVQGFEPNTKRMRLETYVLAAQLEEIVAAANARLRTMTAGRFSLEHDDAVQYRNTRSGLGLAILDAHTGRSRPTHSLSGGETFLASLALALGLAEVVTNQAGGITLDTLFIDEGFGSLDGETLETAMSTLDSLRSGGRTIGLISHVDTMKEQIVSHLRITITDQGFSEIEQ